VTVRPLGTFSVAAKFAVTVPVFPSVTVALPIDTAGRGSSSVIVPRPSPSSMVALTGFESSTLNVSLSSSSVSPLTSTETVCVVSSGRKVSVPDAAV
jgi:hypothetical protein